MRDEAGHSDAAGEARMDESSEYDSYLIALVNDCHTAAGKPVSENIAVAFDELNATATRRRTALLRSTRSN